MPGTWPSMTDSSTGDKRMSRADFVARYGGIYEHSPWVAERVYDASGAPDVEQPVDLISACFACASADEKLALIRAHPDLAGKAAVAGELTVDSVVEQQSARLDQCSAEEFEKFQALNRQYRDKFGFPFIMAVRNSNRRQILETFESRLENDATTEFDMALMEIHKIARLRLEAL